MLLPWEALEAAEHYIEHEAATYAQLRDAAMMVLTAETGIRPSSVSVKRIGEKNEEKEQ